MYRLLWLFYGVLIIYSIVVSIAIPEVPDGGRGVWWNNECVFANWRDVGPLDYATNEAVYSHYSGRPVILLREENSSQYMKDYEGGRKIRMGLDYYALHYVASPIPGLLLEDYGKALAYGAVLTVETGIAANRRYMKVITISAYR